MNKNCFKRIIKRLPFEEKCHQAIARFKNNAMIELPLSKNGKKPICC